MPSRICAASGGSHQVSLRGRFYDSSSFCIPFIDPERQGGRCHSGDPSFPSLPFTGVLELTSDGSMNIGGTTVSVHKGIVRAGRVSYGLVPSGSRVFAKKMNDGSVLITVNGERRYPETQKVNTGRGGTLPQPKLMGK